MPSGIKAPLFIGFLFVYIMLVAKVMLIHAGGYSQRLPNVSVIGKAFMALPCGKGSSHVVCG